jgi:hypothetical protein
MNRQSTVILAALLFAFVVFVTVRGDLPAWLSLFSKQGPKPAPAQAGAGGGSGGGKGGSTLDSAADMAIAATNFIPGVGPAVSTALGIGKKLLGKIF